MGTRRPPLGMRGPGQGYHRIALSHILGNHLSQAQGGIFSMPLETETRTVPGSRWGGQLMGGAPHGKGGRSHHHHLAAPDAGLVVSGGASRAGALP